jgi:hypothetical protein
MRVHLKGIHTILRTLADGKTASYITPGAAARG